MTVVALTQRVDDLADRGERRDALDQAWTAWVLAGGDRPVPVPNALTDPAAYLVALGASALVLTGGNDLAHLPGAQQPAAERDRTERALLDHATAVGLPVLAACRGMQMLVHHWGGTLTRIDGHVACRHDLVPVAAAPWSLRRGPVNSFHDWAVETLGPDLVAIAHAPDGSVEAVAHRTLPQVGVMWHPERAPGDAADRALLTALVGVGA